MIDFSLRLHPDIMFAYQQNYANLIIRVENRGDNHVWCEGDIKVPDGLSLSPTNTLVKGRVRMGILGKNEFLEKSVRIFATQYTAPQVYQAGATVYVFNKDGIIESRMEKKIEIRCERKKEESI